MIDPAKLSPTKEFQDSTRLLSNVNALRAKAEQDGYLFFRGLLPAGKLLELRKQILELCDREGLLDKKFALLDGIVDPDKVNQIVASGVLVGGDTITHDLYLKVQKLQLFHELAHAPELLDVFQRLFGETPFPHPRNIARVIVPHPDLASTPPHQDFVLIQGTAQTWTCWFPLSDLPRPLGGLAILEGSHKAGLLKIAPAKGAGNLEAILCGLDLPWATTDYAAGDVLILHSHTVHKALPNELGDRIRLSCDFRYQPLSLPIQDRSLRAHKDFPWEEVYKDWPNDDFKYYWKKHQFNFSAWDASIRLFSEKFC